MEEKSLFPVAGRTLVEHQVERLRAGGCREIILVGGRHNLKEVRRIFPGMKTVEQKDLDLGMQGALLSALPKIGSSPVMVVSGNDVVEPSAYALLRGAAAKRDGAILAQKVRRYFPGGYLKVTRGRPFGRVTGIAEKPGEGKEPSSLVTIVAHVHNDPKALLAALKKAKYHRDDGYERALAELFATCDYAAVPYEGMWQPVKYPWDLLKLLPLLLPAEPSIHRSASVHPTAVIEGPVTLAAGVRVLPHATIVGPCFVGRGTMIGTNALVRAASIGEDCVIGYNSEVKVSVLADRVWTHSTYLGDSVVGANVAFGGGCVTGNFRLDEGEIASVVGGAPVETGLTKLGAVIGPDCRLGIQVGLNPGVKVGRGTMVAGGTFLTDDVPERSFVRLKDGKVVVSLNRSEVPQPGARRRFRK